MCLSGSINFLVTSFSLPQLWKGRLSRKQYESVLDHTKWVTRLHYGDVTYQVATVTPQIGAASTKSPLMHRHDMWHHGNWDIPKHWSEPGLFLSYFSLRKRSAICCHPFSKIYPPFVKSLMQKKPMTRGFFFPPWADKLQMWSASLMRV